MGTPCAPPGACDELNEIDLTATQDLLDGSLLFFYQGLKCDDCTEKSQLVERAKLARVKLGEFGPITPEQQGEEEREEARLRAAAALQPRVLEVPASQRAQILAARAEAYQKDGLLRLAMLDASEAAEVGEDVGTVDFWVRVADSTSAYVPAAARLFLCLACARPGGLGARANGPGMAPACCLVRRAYLGPTHISPKCPPPLLVCPAPTPMSDPAVQIISPRRCLRAARAQRLCRGEARCPPSL